MSSESPLTTPSNGLSRRQLTKAAAWAVPVVVLATATPAVAGSVLVPQPAPAGRATFQAGVSIGKTTTSSPRVNVNGPGSTVAFFVIDDNDEIAADGLFTSGQVTFTVSWGASPEVPTPGSYTPSIFAANGWTPTALTPGTTGFVTFTYSGLLNGNGATNAVLLPQVRLTPTTGNTLPASQVSTSLSATYLSPITSGIRTP